MSVMDNQLNLFINHQMFSNSVKILSFKTKTSQNSNSVKDSVLICKQMSAVSCRALKRR